MSSVLDLLAIPCLLIGIGFMLLGAIGIVRLPDVYHRIHAMSKTSTLGLLGLLIGAVLHLDSSAVLTKVIITTLFAFVATPVGSHILAKAALRVKAPQWDKTLSDEYAEDHSNAPKE